MSAQITPLAQQSPRALWRFSVLLDNYTPTRASGVGRAAEYVDTMTNTQAVYWVDTASAGIRDAERALYLIDNGATLTPFYVAGWRAVDDNGAVLLHPLTAGFHGLGPSRTYHLSMWHDTATAISGHPSYVPTPKGAQRG